MMCGLEPKKYQAKAMIRSQLHSQMAALSTTFLQVWTWTKAARAFGSITEDFTTKIVNISTTSCA